MGIKRGKTKRPDIIICLSFKHTDTHNQNKATPFQALKGGTLLAEIIALYLLLLNCGPTGERKVQGNEGELPGGPMGTEQFTKGSVCSTWKEECIF